MADVPDKAGRVSMLLYDKSTMLQMHVYMFVVNAHPSENDT